MIEQGVTVFEAAADNSVCHLHSHAFHGLDTYRSYVVPRDVSSIHNTNKTCLCIELSASRATPRFLADSTGSMMLPRRISGNDDFLEFLV